MCIKLSLRSGIELGRRSQLRRVQAQLRWVKAWLTDRWKPHSLASNLVSSCQFDLFGLFCSSMSGVHLLTSISFDMTIILHLLDSLHSLDSLYL